MRVLEAGARATAARVTERSERRAEWERWEAKRDQVCVDLIHYLEPNEQTELYHYLRTGDGASHPMGRRIEADLLNVGAAICEGNATMAEAVEMVRGWAARTP